VVRHECSVATRTACTVDTAGLIWLTLMVDRETTHRNNNKVTRLLKAARLKLQAHPEEIDYQHPRGLHRSQFADLLSSRWIHQHHNVLITGPTDSVW